MCDVCSFLKIESSGPTSADEVLYSRHLKFGIKKQEIVVTLCSEHDRILYLKGVGGFFRIYPELLTTRKNSQNRKD